MAASIFSLFGEIFVDNTSANKSIDQTTDKGEGLGKKLGSVASTVAKGALAAATAVAAFGATAVSSYADYEQAIGGVETLFGDAADTVVANAERAYQTAGVSATDYMEQVTSFSASLLQSLGGDTAAAASYADLAITDMSDNANKMGTDISSIQNAYQGFAKENYTMLDNLKLGYGGTKSEMERLISDAEALDSTFVAARDTNGNLAMSYSDVVDAIHIVQTEMGITGTTQAEAGSTIAGSINMIKQQLSNLVSELGATIAPTIQTVLNFIQERMPMIESLFEELSPVVTSLFDDVLPPLLDLMDEILPIVVDLLRQIVPVVGQMLSAIIPLTTEIISVLMPVATKIIDSLLPVLITLMESTLPLVEALVPLLEPILNYLMTLLEPLFTILDYIMPYIEEGLTILTDILSAYVIPVLSKLFDWVSVKLTEAFTKIGDKLRSVKDDFVNAWNSIQTAWSKAVSFFSKMGEGIKSVFTSVGTAIGNFIKTPINKVISAINSFLRGLTRIKIPSWIPGVGGKGFSFATIPYLAKGGEVTEEGTAIVGERGAELVRLSRGAEVVPLKNGGTTDVSSLEKRLDALTEMLGQYLPNIGTGGVYIDGTKLVGNIAPQIDKALGQRKKIAGRAGSCLA